MTLLIRNPLRTDLVLSGFRALAPGEVIEAPDHIVAMYGHVIEVLQEIPDGKGARVLNFTSTFNPATGYGLGSATLALALARRNIPIDFGGDVRSTGVLDLDVLLRRRVIPSPMVGLIRWIPECFIQCQAPVKVGWTMWDTTRLPSWWVPLLNRVRHVIVPSQGQMDTFRECGVTVPMTAVPEPINLDEYPYHERPERDTFTFVSVSRMCSRKCPLETVECFMRAFPGKDDVRLVMKTIGGAFGAGRMGVPIIDDPRVTIIDQHYRQDQVVSLFHEADAGVFLSRGEGWFHGCVQSMATGLPTIVPAHSGCLAYADEAYNYPIRVSHTEPTDYYVGHMGSHEPFEWWTLDYDQVVETMRHLYENRSEGRAKGKRAAAWVRKQFDVEKTTDKVLGVLDTLF